MFGEMFLRGRVYCVEEFNFSPKGVCHKLVGLFIGPSDYLSIYLFIF